MRLTHLLLGCLAALSQASDINISKPQLSKKILPTKFKPPAVFENVNLVRNINLEKSYPRETINVVIKNVGKEPQSEYYLPFETDLMSRVGGLEVRDRKDIGKPPFKTDITTFDEQKYAKPTNLNSLAVELISVIVSPVEYIRIHLPKPLEPKAELTLGISYHILAALKPRPAAIEQMDKHYVQYDFSAYSPSAYKTSKQKTKIKFPTTDIPDYTTLAATSEGENPSKQGSTFMYGPFDAVPAGAVEPVSVRYEYTHPLLHCTSLERDIEISHWGGNLAIEERYWLTNRAAELKNHFSRVQWQMSQYANPPTSALRELRVPLKIGSANPYYTDDVGNVSTSRWRSNAKEAMLELRPRYPLFGSWNYSFKIGWDANLNTFLKNLKGGHHYSLTVPFLEGPKMSGGITYDRVDVRVILPEGAK